MKTCRLYAGLLFFTSICYSATNISFTIVANGTNAGWGPYRNNHVIGSASVFAAFCDSINLNPQNVDYSPDFDSVQIIGIVYQVSTIQAGHTIGAVINNGDTIWVEITCSIPSPLPDGLLVQPAYKYQMAAIPRQSNPVAFKLVQSVNVEYTGRKVNARLSNATGGSYRIGDLMGRKSTITNIRNSPGLKIVHDEKTSSMIKLRGHCNQMPGK